MSDLAFAVISLLVSLVSLAVSVLMYDANAPVGECRFAHVVPERWRWAHRWFAQFAEYAWQPCPVCGRDFGGHEWRDLDGKTSLIPNPASEFGHLGICPPCTRASRGHRRPHIFDLPDQHHLEGE